MRCIITFVALLPLALANAQVRRTDIWVMQRDGSNARQVIGHPASD